jgi:hypothetical protein
MQRLAFLVLFLALGLVISSPVRAQSSASASLINQQLDKQAKLELSGTLPEVMAQITKQTGVPIEATPLVWELLPWGKETTVTAKIENQTLREALDVITKKLGLVFVLKDEAIELRPMPALKRLGRKSTISELEALSLLSATKLDLGSEKTDLKTLLEAVDKKLADKPGGFAIENRTASSGNPIPQNVPIAVSRNATLMDALEAMAAQTPATWYPWAKTIVVWPKTDQIRSQLKKEVTLRHDNTDIAQVLAELSLRSGVPFQYEPGTFQEIAPQSRQIKLVISCPVLQALDEVCGLTGLNYQVKDESVYIWNAASTTAKPKDRTVAIIQTDTGMQILVTESSCPPDIREFIEYTKEKQFAALRKMMAEQGFKPTAPATKPAKAATQGKPAAKPVEPAGKDL